MINITKFSRSLTPIAILLAMLLLVVACQHSMFVKPKEVTIKLSGWSSSYVEKRLLDNVLEDFKAIHPNIKVEYDVIKKYNDILKKQLDIGAGPDVFYLNAVDSSYFIKKGFLEPLDSYITPSFNKNDFEKELLKPFQYKNITYGFPKDYSILALFYNNSVFKKAGLTRPPETWEELLLRSKQLTIDTNKDGKPDQYGYGIIPKLERQAHTILAAGGEVVDKNGYATFSSDKALKGLSLIVEQYLHDHTSALPDDVSSSERELFGQEKVAMVAEGTWIITYLQDKFSSLDFATAELPLIYGKDIFKNSNEPIQKVFRGFNEIDTSNIFLRKIKHFTDF